MQRCAELLFFWKYTFPEPSMYFFCESIGFGTFKGYFTHYCVSCTSMRYYWEKALLLIVKNVGARDCSVRLYMSSNIFLDTGVFYLFKLVGGGVFENICGEWRRIDFNRIETFKISTTYHLKDTRSTSSHPKMNWKLFMCQHHLIYIYAL